MLEDLLPEITNISIKENLCNNIILIKHPHPENLDPIAPNLQSNRGDQMAVKNTLDKDGNLTQCLNCESVNSGWPLKFGHKIQGYSRIFLAKFKDISRRFLSPKKRNKEKFRLFWR